MTAQIVLVFATLSLLAIGGANPVLPEMHRQLVELRGWLDDRQFTELFALAQAAPGPNILAASAMGWAVAGLSGMLAATFGMLAPAGVLAFAVAGVLKRLGSAPWLRPAQFGLVPVAIGLIAASGLLMAEGAAQSWWGVLVFLGSAAFVWRTALSPLWVLLAGAAAGLLLA